jgi:CDP-4-dehydro-6-deoxyglucose reductase
MKKIRLLPSGKEVDVAFGETVLSALEKEGYALPNNCRAGACGECKTKVISGDYDQGFILDMALPPEDREAGYGLMCMAKQTSDLLEIEFETEGNRPKLFPPEENRTFIVMEKYLATPSIMKIRLKAMGGPMKFWPGQYVTIGNEDKNIPARCYSLASIPNPEGEISLHVTKVDGGKASTWLHDEVNEGDRISLSGPYGTFIGDPSEERPVLCLASGSGLAPIASLASAALIRGGFKHPATVLFSARTQSDIYETGLFNYLSSKFRNFNFMVTTTREKSELSGRIPEILPEKFPDLSGHSLYIAGNPSFVEDCIEACKKLGAAESHIYTEKYVDQSGD